MLLCMCYICVFLCLFYVVLIIVLFLLDVPHVRGGGHARRLVDVPGVVEERGVVLWVAPLA